MKTVLFVCLMTFLNVSFAQHDHGLSNAKLAHDASHRLGHLVDAGRIDNSYVNNLSALSVTALPHTFKVVASVGSGANKMDLLFDMSGKFLSNQVSAQGPAEPSPWTETPGAELIEAALHALMDAASSDLAPFVSNLSTISLKQAKKDDGSIEALVLVTSSTTPKTLQVTLSTAGAILAMTILE